MTAAGDQRAHRYSAMIATGGIGSGIFAELIGNHSLGREESRAVHFLNRRDYCKGHIVSHYVQVLMPFGFETILIGKVGEDSAGTRLLDELRESQINVQYVRVVPGGVTLYAVCFVYPDGSGGNFTSQDSASSQVSEADVNLVEKEFRRIAGAGIALAVPEVPLSARRRILEFGTRYNFFRAGSFISGEITEALQLGLFELLDLVALNLDEANALIGYQGENLDPPDIAVKAIERLRKEHPQQMVSVTAGKHGSWSWDGRQLQHLSTYPTEVVNTAGAGDAHLAGIIVGLALGLPLSQAHEIGNLTAALSVTSPHTIAPEVNRKGLRDFASRREIDLSKPVKMYLNGWLDTGAE